MTDADAPVEVQQLAERIRRAHADDLSPVTAATEYGTPGTEPIVVVYVGGVSIVELRRDDFLDALYVAGCDVIEAEMKRRAN
jgi:hypothetical protein